MHINFPCSSFSLRFVRNNRRFYMSLLKNSENVDKFYYKFIHHFLKVYSSAKTSAIIRIKNTEVLQIKGKAKELGKDIKQNRT